MTEESAVDTTTDLRLSVDCSHRRRHRYIPVHGYSKETSDQSYEGQNASRDDSLTAHEYMSGCHRNRPDFNNYVNRNSMGYSISSNRINPEDEQLSFSSVMQPLAFPSDQHPSIPCQVDFSREHMIAARDADLLPTLDCSHRKHRIQGRYDVRTEFNGYSDTEYHRDSQIHVDPHNQSDSILETGLNVSDLHLTHDCSHRRHNHRQNGDLARDLQTKLYADSDLQVSLDCSHRRSHHKLSLSLDSAGLETASVCSALKISIDTSHRGRKSVCESKSEEDSLDKDLLLISKCQHRKQRSDTNIKQKQGLKKLQSKKTDSHQNSEEILRSLITKPLCEVQSTDNSETDCQQKMNKLQNSDKEMSKFDSFTNNCDKGRTSETNLRSRRKRFRSGSDSNLLISSKRRLNEQKLDGTISSNDSKDLNIKENSQTKNKTKVIGDNISKKTKIQNHSKTVNSISQIDMKVCNKIDKCLPSTTSGSCHRPANKRRSWHGMDKKQRLIQKIHQSIAKFEVHDKLAGDETEVDGAKDLNLSTVEDMMPLKGICNEYERKVRHKFIRKNGVLYRRHDNGAIWKAVVSKYV